MSRARPRSDGFSLIEVLVALTLLALVLTPLMEVVSQGLRAIGAGDARVRAVAVARARLAEIEAGIGEEEREGQGEIDDGTRTYRWQVRFEPWPGDAHGAPGEGPVVPRLATAEVTWGEGPGADSVSLSTLVLGVVR